MEKSSMRRENQDNDAQYPSLWKNKEERLALDMVLELSIRFGLLQPHDVASVLKVSPDEAKRLLGLATERMESV